MRSIPGTAVAAVVLTALAGAVAVTRAPSTAPLEEWASYGHASGGTRYSSLTDLTTANVADLKVAWTFHTGDVIDGSGNQRTGFEATPIIVDGLLYVTTGRNRIIALDPETGTQRWSYDPHIDPGWG